MRKLLQFLSIGILSSSVTTSVVACNNNEQKNLNKNDEHRQQLKEVQNKELESKKGLKEILNIKTENDSQKQEINNNPVVLPTPVPRNRLKRELNPIPAPRIKKETISLENKEVLINENQATNPSEELISEEQIIDEAIEKDEDFEEFVLADEYIDDNEQELLTVEKEQDNQQNFESEIIIEELIKDMKELNDNLEEEYETLFSEQGFEPSILLEEQVNELSKKLKEQDSSQKEVVSSEPIEKESEIILRTDVNVWKETLDKKIRKIKTLSDNLENREKELLNFQEQINEKQKTIDKLEDNFSEISKEIKTFETKPKRKIGVIIDNVYHDGNHDGNNQEIKVDINNEIDLNKDEKIIVPTPKQEVTNKASLLKSDLNKISKFFKLELERNKFYIKGGKDISHLAKQRMLFDSFLAIFSKFPNHDNYKYRIELVSADNSETQHIQYIIETKLRKPGTNKPFDFRLSYATVSVDWVTVNKNMALIKEFKSKLENKLLKSEFKIFQEQFKKVAFFLKEQTDKIINKLNKEKKYNFTFKSNDVWILDAKNFNLHLVISKSLPNSLSQWTEEIVSIKLSYKIID